LPRKKKERVRISEGVLGKEEWMSRRKDLSTRKRGALTSIGRAEKIHRKNLGTELGED